jgi:pimeloyl-ACP methyl ester carboxylesterase
VNNLSSEVRRSRPAATTRVILIHGISTAGAWQDEISPLLRHFFSPISLRYPHYRRWGAFKLVVEPIVLIGLLAAIALTSWLRGVSGYMVLVLVVSSTLISIGFAYVRRRLSVDSCIRQAGDSFLGRPHVIAHSFGTYITLQMLKRVHAASVDRAVLLGCVLSRRTDWVTVAARTGLSRIRNEWTAGDKVPKLAGALKFLIPNFGDAGYRGFDFGSGQLHKVPDPHNECPGCVDELPALIHDVDLSRYGHSEVFLTRDHAARFWLPFFWDIDPAEYWKLLDTCRRYTEADEKSDWKSLALIEGHLRADVTWNWIDGALWDKLGIGLERATGIVPDASEISRAVRIFCLSVTFASRDGYESEAVVMLNPYWALAHAVTA